MIGILAKKVGMTEVFNEHGRAVAVTVLEAGPCTVTQVKEPKTDGYRAIQLGFEPVKENRLTKALQGHFKKAGTAAFRYLREFRVDEQEPLVRGQQVTVEIFKEGEVVDVAGTSIDCAGRNSMRASRPTSRAIFSITSDSRCGRLHPKLIAS